MKALIAVLVVLAPATGESRFERFERDLNSVQQDLRIAKMSAAIVENGRVVWRRDEAVRGAPLTQSATAVRVMQLVKQGRMSLDDPVAFPKGATIRQVLSHTADGNPGAEFLYNPDLVESLAAMIGAVRAPSTLGELTRFAAALDTARPAAGLFSQKFSGERLVWDFAQTEASSTLLVLIPARKLRLIVLANSKAMTEAAHLEDGNVVRSRLALTFLEDLVFMRNFPRESLEDFALEAPYFGGDRADIVREALRRFPELETSDDLTLLGLLSQLHFPETESVATAVIGKHPYLPPAWLYYGKYLRNEKRFREATICFEQIRDHHPPWHHWSVGEAKKELSTLE